MSEPQKTKSVDAVYTDIITHLEESLAPLSPVARGMLLASIKQKIGAIQRERLNTLDRIEKL